MEYPATQMFVDDDEEEDAADGDVDTPLRSEKNVKVGVLLVGSVTYPVHKGVNRIGRIDSCSIVIDHDTISKEHAEIEAGVGSKSTFISDLGSLNKTKLNDAILRPGRLYQLQDGDVVRFGSITAIFKLEETNADNSVVQPGNSAFLIPETPPPIAKDVHPVIPGSPELSFDKSLPEEDRTGDASVIAGTQEVANTVSSAIYGRDDISDLETQKNISANTDQSDDENIFDMLTQKTDIHDDETQRFSTDNVIQAVKPRLLTVVKKELNSQSLADEETQIFSTDGVGAVAGLGSINDLETQMFTADDLRQKTPSINDVETQKVEAFNDTGGGEDSDTDEDGIFESSDDVFDAATQLIRPPREASKSPWETLEDMTGGVETKDEKEAAKPEEIEERNREERVQSPAVEAAVTAEKKLSTLNDSIESKLNHMFDDVNESAVDEPTQMLTQHLEKILESTQADEPGLKEIAANVPGAKNAGQAAEDANNARSDDDQEELEPAKKTVPRKSFQVLKLLDSEELFADLPPVHILGTSSSRSIGGRIKVSPSLDVAVTSGAKKAEELESDESVESKRPKNAESVEDKSRTSPKANRNRRKPRSRNTVVSPDSSAGSVEEAGAKVEEPMKSESRKGLPLKKRGSSIASSPPTPQKIVAEDAVVPTARTATRSNVEKVFEIGKRSTRSSAAEIPKVPALKSTGFTEKRERLESPDKTEPLNRSKKATRSKRAEEVLKPEVEPQPTSTPRGISLRLRKKFPSAVASEEKEVAEAKRLPSNVNDSPRPPAQREQRKKANSREPSVSESCAAGVGLNESLTTRSRRARLAANTLSADNVKNSAPAVENFDNASYQPSLESQEIQAILGVAGEGIAEARGSGRSRYRKEARVFPSHMTGNDFRKDQEDRESSRQELPEFSKTGASKQADDDGFEKPVARPERKKRQLSRFQLDDDDTETSKKRSKPDASPKRGKKNTADAANERNLPKPEPSGVVVAAGTAGSLNVKSGIKSTKKGKTKAIDLPPPVIVALEATPKSRTRGVSRRLEVSRAEKENVIEVSAPKRGRKRAVESKPGKQSSEASLNDVEKTSESSSPLRRGRSSLSTPTSSGKTIKHKILFTGLNDPGLVSIVNSLGGTVTERPNDCTALVTDKVRRTYKFLYGMATAVPIVSVEWLNESEKRGRFLDTGDFILYDPVAEAKFGFNLRRSLAMTTGARLLEGYTVVLTPNTAPPPLAEMKGMIQACGGKVLARAPARWPEKSLIISREEDAINAKKFTSKAPKSVRLMSVEFILTGILRHELNFEEHKLDI